ncbi:MAG: ParB/RepB/Spo0J family partition protein [Ruminococcaceae bacterium]|nr:ParB/RepB/Spo0J family partition protein [Oscillospiraceae bacterium]
MAKKPTNALGRGLSDLSGMGQDALFGQPEVKSAASAGSVHLPISQVEPGLNQPRKRFEPEALADLADSIRTHGIIQPITVRKLSSGYYQIIAGERRWRAAKAAGLEEVPAVIIEADDRKVMELGLIENLQREDLNPVEEAKGYQVLIQEHGLTQEEVAQRMGKSRPAITNALRLLALPEAVLILLEEGSLSAGHARAILAAPTPELQIQAAQQTATQNLSVRQTEALVKALQKTAQEPKSADPLSPGISIYLAEVEKTLSSRFGRKVRIVDKGNKGRIELEYYDISDLDALLDALELSKGGSAQ